MIRIKNGYAEPEYQPLVNGIPKGTTWRGFHDITKIGESVKWKHGYSPEEVEKLINQKENPQQDESI